MSPSLSCLTAYVGKSIVRRRGIPESSRCLPQAKCVVAQQKGGVCLNDSRLRHDVERGQEAQALTRTATLHFPKPPQAAAARLELDEERARGRRRLAGDRSTAGPWRREGQEVSSRCGWGLRQNRLALYA